jgi:hypothetical protein
MIFSKIVSRWAAAKRSICYVLLIVFPSQAFVSCAGGRFLGVGRGNKYVYAYTMVAPVESPTMTFQDDSLKVQFKIDDAAIRFQLQNLTRGDMSVRWNKVTIGVDNAYSLVRHSVTMYSDTLLDNRSVAVPPRGYIQDLIFPMESVHFNGTEWVESDLFQTTDGGREAMAATIEKNVGKSIVVSMPIAFGPEEKTYRFEFRVVSVKHVLWRDVKPPKRPPPPRREKKKTELADEVTTAFIVVGLLGFTAFMVSLKKEPVVE